MPFVLISRLLTKVMLSTAIASSQDNSLNLGSKRQRAEWALVSLADRMPGEWARGTSRADFPVEGGLRPRTTSTQACFAPKVPAASFNCARIETFALRSVRLRLLAVRKDCVLLGAHTALHAQPPPLRDLACDFREQHRHGSADNPQVNKELSTSRCTCRRRGSSQSTSTASPLRHTFRVLRSRLRILSDPLSSCHTCCTLYQWLAI